MGVLNYTTAKVNELLDKIDKAPDTIENGKTPVFVTGTTTTLDPGLSATAEVVQDGVDENGNPKYKINFGVPKGLDGASGEGGGGTADSVQWGNILNMPSWVNSATKPTYTASEVGALPADTTIPSKTSQLTNDSNFLTSEGLKTINGESIVGSGNISLSGTGGIAEAPKDGKTYGRNNGSWVETSQMEEAPNDGSAYARKNKGWITILESTEKALLNNYIKADSYSDIDSTDSINSAIGKLEAGIKSNTEVVNLYFISSNILNLKEDSTSNDLVNAFGGNEKIDELIQNVKNGFQVYIKSNTTIIPVSVYVPIPVMSLQYVRIIFTHSSSISTTSSITKDILFLHIGTSNTISKISTIYNEGYKLDSKLYSLTSSSSSEDISSAIGGESGMISLINAIKSGNRIYIGGDLETGTLRVDISINSFTVNDNGDMMISLGAFGFYIWGTSSICASMIISYTKSTNEFTIMIAGS